MRIAADLELDQSRLTDESLTDSVAEREERLSVFLRRIVDGNGDEHADSFERASSRGLIQRSFRGRLIVVSIG